jgi:hypothetical protein
MHNNISDTISNTIKQIATIINFNGNNVHEFDDCSNRYEAPSRLGYLINASNNADNDMVGTMEVSKDSFLYRTVDKNNIQQQDIYGKLSKGKSVHFMNTSLLGNIRIVNKTGISITNAFMILQLNKNIKLLDLRKLHHYFGIQLKAGENNNRGLFNVFEERSMKYIAEIYNCHGIILYDIADIQTPTPYSHGQAIIKQMNDGSYQVTSAWQTQVDKLSKNTGEVIQLSSGYYLTPEIVITDTSVLDIYTHPDASNHALPINIKDETYKDKFIYTYDQIKDNTFVQNMITGSFLSNEYINANVPCPWRVGNHQSVYKIISNTNNISHFLNKLLENLNKIKLTPPKILDLINDKMELKSIGTKIGYIPIQRGNEYNMRKPGKERVHVTGLKSQLFKQVLYYSRDMIKFIYTDKYIKLCILSIIVSWKWNYKDRQYEKNTQFRDNLKNMFSLENRFFEYNEPVKKYILDITKFFSNELTYIIETILKESRSKEKDKIKKGSFRRYLHILEDIYNSPPRETIIEIFNANTPACDLFLSLYKNMNNNAISIFDLSEIPRTVVGDIKSYNPIFLPQFFFQIYLKGGTCMRTLYYTTAPKHKTEAELDKSLGSLSDFDYNISINAFLNEKEYNYLTEILTSTLLHIFDTFADDKKYNIGPEYHKKVKGLLLNYKHAEIPCPIEIDHTTPCLNNVKIRLKSSNKQRVEFKKQQQPHLYIQGSDLDFASSGAKFRLLRLMYQYKTKKIQDIMSNTDLQIELIDVSIIAFCATEKLDTWLHAKPQFLNLQNKKLTTTVPVFSPQAKAYNSTKEYNSELKSMSEQDKNDNKGFLIRGGHIKFVYVSYNEYPMLLPLYDLGYSIDDLNLVIRENIAQGRLNKLKKRQTRVKELTSIMCTWEHYNMSDSYVNMCGKALFGSYNLDITLNEKKYAFLLMQQIMKKEQCSLDSNSMGACMLKFLINLYYEPEIFPSHLINDVIKHKTGHMVFTYLCYGVLLINPYINRQNHLPTNRVITKYLIGTTIKFIRQQLSTMQIALNEMQMQSKHLAMKFAIEFHTKYTHTMDYIQELLQGGEFYSSAINLIHFHPEIAYMDFCNNYGCLIVDTYRPTGSDISDYLTNLLPKIKSKIPKHKDINVILSKHILTGKLGITFNYQQFSFLTIRFNNVTNVNNIHILTKKVIETYINGIRNKLHGTTYINMQHRLEQEIQKNNNLQQEKQQIIQAAQHHIQQLNKSHLF